MFRAFVRRLARVRPAFGAFLPNPLAGPACAQALIYQPNSPCIRGDTCDGRRPPYLQGS